VPKSAARAEIKLAGHHLHREMQVSLFLMPLLHILWVRLLKSDHALHSCAFSFQPAGSIAFLPFGSSN